MKKITLLKRLYDNGVVAVLRGETAEQAVELAERAIAGGLRFVEVAFTVPGAHRAIETLAKRYAGADSEDRPVIGAGTVLDTETARVALLNGAEYIVSPGLNPETVKLCHRYRVPIMPGAMTIDGVQTALELGVDVIKLFPGQLFSPSMIKAIHGPLPHANLMPTGGVSLDNLAEWIQAGAYAVGIGSDLTAEAVKTGDFRRVEEKAGHYLAAFRAAAERVGRGTGNSGSDDASGGSDASRTSGTGGAERA